MGLSTIQLNNPESVRLDDSGKSNAFFCVKRPVKVNHALIEELKTVFWGLKDKNLRLCLHSSPEALSHDMIILERKGRYYTPHKHAEKGETFHMIEGRMGVFIFDDSGKVIDSTVLDPASDFLYKVGDDMFHAVMPLTDYVVYHESKTGPFTGEGDSIFASFAPEESELDKIEAFYSQLLKKLEGA